MVSFQPSTKLNDPRYPRPRWFRLLRWACRLWWLAFSIYPANVVFNIYTVIGNQGLNALRFRLAEVFLLYQTLLLWQQYRWLVVPPLLVLSTILVALGKWASRDQEKEKNTLALRQVTQLHDDNASRLVANATSVVRNETLAAVNQLTNNLIDRIEERFRKANTIEGISDKGPPLDASLLPQPHHFVGRNQELHRLTDRLRKQTSRGVAAVQGMPGIGKTALAAVAVNNLCEGGYFKDGIAVIECSSFKSAIEILQVVLSRFDPMRRRPNVEDIAGLTDIARYLLGGKDALVVLDNVELMETVEPVVSTLQACGARLLLTSRNVFPRSVVPAEATLELGLLEPDESIELFSRSFGNQTKAEFTAIQLAAVKRISNALGRHTLAVKLAGAYAADAHRDLGTLATVLEHDPLDLFAGEIPRAVTLIFAQSVELLPEDSHLLFASLSAIPTAEFSREAALAVGGAVGLGRCETPLNKLIMRALIESFVLDDMPEDSHRERLRLHPLVRSLSLQQFAQWTNHDKCTASLGVGGYYSEYVASNQNSYSTLSYDEFNIEGLIEWAHTSDQKELLANLCVGMRSFWLDRWKTLKGIRYLSWAVEALREIGKETDRLAWADLALARGQLLWRSGDIESANQIFLENLSIRRTESDFIGECEVLRSLGNLAWRRGKLRTSESYLEEALKIAEANQNKTQEAQVLLSLGRLERDQGHLENASMNFEKALIIVKTIGDRRLEALVTYHVGLIDQDRGNLDTSDRAFAEALAINQEIMNRRDEGSTLARLAYNAGQRGESEKAHRYYKQCLSIYREVNDQLAVGWVSRVIGDLLQETQQLTLAKTHYLEALEIATRGKDIRNLGVVLTSMGNLAIKLGDVKCAESYYQKALEYARTSRNKRNEGIILGSLGVVSNIQEQYKAAEEQFREGLEILVGIGDLINHAKILIDFVNFLVNQQRSHEVCGILCNAIALHQAGGSQKLPDLINLARKFACTPAMEQSSPKLFFGQPTLQKNPH